MAEALTSVVPLRPVGRARSSLNHVKSGIFARSEILPGEDRDEYVSHVQGYIDYFQPMGKPEEDAVLTVALQAWREQRLSAGLVRHILALCEEERGFQSLMESVKLLRAEIDAHVQQVETLEQERRKGTARHAAAVRAAAELVRHQINLLRLQLDRMKPDELVDLSPKIRELLTKTIEQKRKELGKLNDEISRLRKEPDPAWAEAVDRERTRLLRSKERALRVLHMTRTLGGEDSTASTTKLLTIHADKKGQ